MAKSVPTLIHERLGELSPADTFSHGLYRLLAWCEETPSELEHQALEAGARRRLSEWADITQHLSARLREASRR